MSLSRYPRPCRVGLMLVGLLAVGAAAGCGGDGDDPGGTDRIGGSMILATTTSTRDSGLLDELIPRFQEATGIEVKVIAVGTGAALEMSARGDADAILVHAPESEQKYIDSGDLVGGKLVMHNDFIIVGPASDPAGAKSASSLGDAMGRIAAAGPFVSRGDDSGTHKKELALWAAAGVNPAKANREETGQGMGATLQIASQRRAYTLTDRATFLAQRNELSLVVVFEGARDLLNIYHVYVVSPEKHAGVKRPQAEAFVAFLISQETQEQIGEFGKARFGEPLFFPDALPSPATAGSR